MVLKKVGKSRHYVNKNNFIQVTMFSFSFYYNCLFKNSILDFISLSLCQEIYHRLLESL